MPKSPRYRNSPTSSFALPHFGGGRGTGAYLIRFEDGRLYFQPLNPRLTTSEVAELLVTDEDGIAYLVRAKLLKPLGNPTGNKARYFGSEYLNGLMTDGKWLNKITDALYRFSEERNQAARQRRANSPPPLPTSPAAKDD